MIEVLTDMPDGVTGIRASGRITGELPTADATQERLMALMTMEKETAR